MLDVGGTPEFWRMMQFSVPAGSEICVLNLDLPSRVACAPGITFLRGDATNLSDCADSSFDVVFSNSVIEHVGDFNAQRRMASEVRRVGVRHFVQTPNYLFPIEPHFLLPGMQWLPEHWRAEVVHRLRPGWYGRDVRSRSEAAAVVHSIQLLRRRDLEVLFPESSIFVERVLGIAKSFIAYGGWDTARPIEDQAGTAATASRISAIGRSSSTIL
jgi:SAM-dependent methyltransferase